MRKSIVKENVGDFGKIMAQELTVADLDQLLYPVKSNTPVLDRLLARHGVSTAAVNKSLGLELRDDMELPPSELVDLVEIFKEVNPDFFLALEHERKQEELIARIDAVASRK